MSFNNHLCHKDLSNTAYTLCSSNYMTWQNAIDQYCFKEWNCTMVATIHYALMNTSSSQPRQVLLNIRGVYPNPPTSASPSNPNIGPILPPPVSTSLKCFTFPFHLPYGIYNTRKEAVTGFHVLNLFHNN